MRLLPELARKLIEEVRQVLNEQIIIVDDTAAIIASTEESRIGEFHGGASHVLKTKEKLYLAAEHIRIYKGVKPGINLPISFQHEIIGVIGITGNPEKIEPFADLLLKMTELLIKETYYASQVEWQTRGLEAFIYEWVFKKESVDDDFIKRGQLLGLAIGTPYSSLMIEAKASNPTAVSFFLHNWFKHQSFTQKEDLFIFWGEDTFLLLLQDNDNKERANSTHWHYLLDSFRKKFPQGHCSIGISQTLTYTHLYRGYYEADKALRTARKKGTIVHYNELLLEIVVQEMSTQTRTEFVQRVFGDLIYEHELLYTLKAYLFFNQSKKETAASLHIHKNTLQYRLKQITERTQIDLTHAHGLTLFYLAFLFHDEVPQLNPIKP